MVRGDPWLLRGQNILVVVLAVGVAVSWQLQLLSTSQHHLCAQNDSHARGLRSAGSELVERVFEKGESSIRFAESPRGGTICTREGCTTTNEKYQNFLANSRAFLEGADMPQVAQAATSNQLLPHYVGE